MMKIKELCRDYPATTQISLAFTSVFVFSGSVGIYFDRSLWEAFFMAACFGAVSGTIAAVKKLDKDNESE